MKNLKRLLLIPLLLSSMVAWAQHIEVSDFAGKRWSNEGAPLDVTIVQPGAMYLKGDSLFFMGQDGECLYMWDRAADSLEQIRCGNLANSNFDLFADDTTVYYGDVNNAKGLEKIDIRTGEVSNFTTVSSGGGAFRPQGFGIHWPSKTVYVSTDNSEVWSINFDNPGDQDSITTLPNKAVSLNVSPSGDTLIMGERAGNSRIFRYIISTGTLETLTAMPSRINALEMMPDFNTAVVALQNDEIWSYDIAADTAIKLAGGNSGFRDSSEAMEARFDNPQGIEIDPEDGSIFVSDMSNNRIRRITPGPNRAVETAAGSPRLGDGPLAEAKFAHPHGIAFFGEARFVADANNNAIRKIENGEVTTIGTGNAGMQDGDANQAMFNNPTDVLYHRPTNRVYVADKNNGALRSIDPSTLEVATINDTLGGPKDLATMGTDTIVVVANDHNNIYALNLTDSTRSTIINGNGSNETDTLGNVNLKNPHAIAQTPMGWVIVRDDNPVQLFTPANDSVKLIAGGARGFNFQNGLNSRLEDPLDVVYDGYGGVLIAEKTNHIIRRVKLMPPYQTSVIAGKPEQAGFMNGMGSEAMFDRPTSIDKMIPNTYIIGERGNRILRKMTITPNSAPSLSTTQPTIEAAPGNNTLMGMLNISKGEEDFEQSQELSFEFSTADSSIFETMPSINPADSSISFELAPNIQDTSFTLDVTIKDDGGTEFGGVDSAKTTMNFSVTPTGMQSLSNQSQIRAFPNPAQDYLQIEGLSERTAVQLLDVSGRQVFSRSLNSGAHRIDLSRVPKGFYLLQLKGAHTALQTKLVVR